MIRKAWMEESRSWEARDRGPLLLNESQVFERGVASVSRSREEGERNTAGTRHGTDKLVFLVSCLFSLLSFSVLFCS